MLGAVILARYFTADVPRHAPEWASTALPVHHRGEIVDWERPPTAELWRWEQWRAAWCVDTEIGSPGRFDAEVEEAYLTALNAGIVPAVMLRCRHRPAAWNGGEVSVLRAELGAVGRVAVLGGALVAFRDAIRSAENHQSALVLLES